MEVLQLDWEAAEEFCRLRMDLFRELGELCPGTDVPGLERATERYYLEHIGKDLFAWGIFSGGGKLRAAAALCLFSRLPYAGNFAGAEGYLLSVYTAPEYWRRGFVGEILDRVLAFSRERGLRRVWLSSSDQGRALYASRGFLPRGGEMERILE